MTALFAACALLCGCGNGQTAVTTTTTAETTTAAETEASSVEGISPLPETSLSLREQAESITAGMAVEQKIAQMITVSFRYWNDTPDNPYTMAAVTALNEQQKALLKKYDFGGIILFKQACGNTEQIVDLTNEIQEAARSSEPGIPMLITTDQEGGNITRLVTGTMTSGNMALGATCDPGAAYDNAAIIGSELDDSVVRIIELKLEKGIITAEPADAAKAKTIVGSKEHHDKELEVAERGITLLKNDDNTLPLIMQENEKVAYFYPYAGEENTMTFALDRLKAEGIVPGSVTAECRAFTENSASDDYEGITNDVAGYEELIKGCKAVIISTETYRTGNMDITDETRAWQAVFSDEMTALAHKNGIKVVHLSMHLPYDAVRYNDADALLCAYCGQDMPVIPTEYDGDTQTYGVNYPAALITVFGGYTPTGKLPVDLPAYTEGVGYTDEIVFPIGYGLTFSEPTT